MLRERQRFYCRGHSGGSYYSSRLLGDGNPPCCVSAGESRGLECEGVTNPRGVEAAVNLSHITMSSDGNGSMPRFDEEGNIVGVGVGTQASLLEKVRDLCLLEGMSLQEAIQVVTSNVAHAVKLWPRKRGIQVGADADLLVLAPRIKVNQVWARRQLMGQPVVFGTFEVVTVE